MTTTGPDPEPAPGLAPAWEARIGALVERLAWLLAVLGGVILVAVVVMTVVSIFGRTLAGAARAIPFLPRLGPVPGDFELVEAGTAIAVFAFLPWCQLRRGHITVDVFLFWAGPRARAVLTLIGNVLLTGAAAFIAWRLQVGMWDKILYRETTMILRMPVWYGYAAALVGAWTFALVSLYTVWRSINEVARGHEAAT